MFASASLPYEPPTGISCAIKETMREHADVNPEPPILETMTCAQELTKEDAYSDKKHLQKDKSKSGRSFSKHPVAVCIPIFQPVK